MLSSNLCCRFETVPHCEKKRSTSPPEVGCVIKNSTLSWKGEGARDCHHSCKVVEPLISIVLQRVYKLHCSAISGSPLTAGDTNRHVRWTNQKNCEKIAGNCGKLRKMSKNCEMAENCEKIMDRNFAPSPPPPPCLIRGPGFELQQDSLRHETLPKSTMLKGLRKPPIFCQGCPCNFFRLCDMDLQ